MYRVHNDKKMLQSSIVFHLIYIKEKQAWTVLGQNAADEAAEEFVPQA